VARSATASPNLFLRKLCRPIGGFDGRNGPIAPTPGNAAHHHAHHQGKQSKQQNLGRFGGGTLSYWLTNSAPRVGSTVREERARRRY